MVEVIKSHGDGLDGTGIMRARDVNERLRGKIDQKVVDVIATLAEINHANVKAIGETAAMLEQMANIVTNFVQVADNMRKKIVELTQHEESVSDSGEVQ